MHRVIIPDSHGEHIDVDARNAFLKDLKKINPAEIIMLGDHVDAGGTFSTHQRNYTLEMVESYEDDCAAANDFLDEIQKAAPRAVIDYIEGNHEAHVERWASRLFQKKKDADAVVEAIGPAKKLDLKARGIRYFKSSEKYQGISIPGTIKRGKCFFTHGISYAKNATQIHLDRFGACVVHGHTHTAAEARGRKVVQDGIGAWCPGTLAKLQPLYRHSTPTNWSHGYGLQFVAKSGLFLNFNVPIVGGESLLMIAIKGLK